MAGVLDQVLKVADFIDSASVGKVLVELQAAMGDLHFAKNPPVARVYLLRKRIDDDGKFADEIGKPEYAHSYVSVNTPATHRTFSWGMDEAVVETGSRGLFGGKSKTQKKEPLPVQQIWALVVPHGAWAERYRHEWFPLHVRRGSTVSLPVYLPPHDARRERRNET